YIQAVTVGGPACDGIAACVIEPAGVIGRPGRAVDRGRTVRQLCRARLELDVDAVGSAVLERSWSGDAEAVHPIVAQECADIRLGVAGQYFRDQGGAVVDLDVDRSIQPVAISSPAVDCVTSRMVDKTNIIRWSGRAGNHGRAARELRGAGLEFDVDAMGRTILE